MRKSDPQLVRQQFDDGVLALLKFLGRVETSLAGSHHEKNDLSQLASTTFLALYVQFEKFQSDLFLAYLNRDFTVYQNSKFSAIRSSVGAKYGQWFAGRVALTPIKHVRADDLEAAVDPTGWNLTFKDTDQMKERAAEWLAPTYAGAIRRLTNHDGRLIDTAKSIRDFIAHGSASSKDRMNERLATVSQGPYNAGLDRGAQKIHNLGAYLKAVVGGRRRIVLYAERLQDIAARM